MKQNLNSDQTCFIFISVEIDKDYQELDIKMDTIMLNLKANFIKKIMNFISVENKIENKKVVV